MDMKNSPFVIIRDTVKVVTALFISSDDALQFPEPTRIDYGKTCFALDDSPCGILIGFIIFSYMPGGRDIDFPIWPLLDKHVCVLSDHDHLRSCMPCALTMRFNPVNGLAQNRTFILVHIDTSNE